MTSYWMLGLVFDNEFICLLHELYLKYTGFTLLENYSMFFLKSDSLFLPITIRETLTLRNELLKHPRDEVPCVTAIFEFWKFCF